MSTYSVHTKTVSKMVNIDIRVSPRWHRFPDCCYICRTAKRGCQCWNFVKISLASGLSSHAQQTCSTRTGDWDSSRTRFIFFRDSDSYLTLDESDSDSTVEDSDSELESRARDSESPFWDSTTSLMVWRLP